MKRKDGSPAIGSLRTISRTAAAILVAAAMTFGAGAAAIPAAAVSAADEVATAQAERPASEQQIIDVFNGINTFRKGKGLPPLRIGMNASAVAQEWSAGMAKTGLLEHSTSHANDMRIADWWSASENLASTNIRSGQQLVDMWINSPGHNANMSRPGDNVIGVGVASDWRNHLWGTTTYYRYDPLVAKTYATAEEYLAAIAVPAVPAEVPVILGTPAYGEVLRLKAATWPAGTTLSYQWWGGTRRIDGATGSTLTVPAEATREKISVEVTAKAPGYRETSIFSAQTERVPEAGRVQNTTAPKITGTPEWGQTLTLDPGVWEQGTKLTYEWNSGETGLTHVVEKYDKSASVKVTGTKAGMYDTTVTATLAIPAPTLTYSVKPSIKGIAAVGQNLRADGGTWNVNPILSYTWLRNGVAIPGSSFYSSYTLTEADLGAVITFSADVHLQGYAGMTFVADPTAPVKPALTVKNVTKPTIVGAAVEGNTLLSTPGTWENGIVALDYQWLRDGQPISDARADFLPLTAADVGRKISLQVIGRGPSGYTPTIATSAAVTVASKTTGPTPNSGFRDVSAGMQFATEINWMNSEGISTGWEDNTYRPHEPVARDAMSAFMYRLADSPAYTAPGSSPFRDVVKGQQFYLEMSWLASTGVSTGWSDGTYKPLTSVNRDAMAAFMYRLAGSPAFTAPEKSPFADVDTSNQFYKEISWLADQGISTGWDQPDGTKIYQPVAPVRRDAMAAFMYRFDQKGFTLTGAR